MVPPTGPVPAKIMIVGEAPGENEVRFREPFVGESGKEMNRMLQEAGIMRSECFITNVCRERPPGNDIDAWMPKAKKNVTPDMVPVRGRMVKQIVADGIEMLSREIAMVKPNVIIAFGNTPLWALTGKTGIKSWRGSLLQTDDDAHIKVIPAYHPAYILRDWQQRQITVQDLRRACAESKDARVEEPQNSTIIRPQFDSTIEVLNAIYERLCGRQRVPSAEQRYSTVLLDVDGQNKLARISFDEKGGTARSWFGAETLVWEQVVYKPSTHSLGNARNEQQGQDTAQCTKVGGVVYGLEGGRNSQGHSSEDGDESWGDSLQSSKREEKLCLSVDIETRAGHIACLGIAWAKNEALCIPFMCVEVQAGYWMEEQETAVIQALFRVLCHPNAQIVGQNFIYDAQYIYRHWGFVPNFARDTMLGHHVCFPGMQKGLDFLSSMYCQKHVYWKDESKDWDPKIGEEQLWAYNGKDCIITYEVDAAIQRQVDKLGLREQHDFQMAMWYPVLEAMIRGVRVDLTRRSDFAILLMEEMKKREEWFEYVLGHPLNPSSNVQMKRLFYEDLAQRVITNRATGAPTLNDEALQTVAKREPLLRPLVRRIQEYRSLGVYSSTFVGATLGSDSRLRCSYNIAGTETFRLSASQDAFGSGLNLQTIPPGGAVDKDNPDSLQLPNVRTLFVPDAGKTWFDLDLDRADLQVVVWECGDEGLKKALRAGVDMHLYSARDVYDLNIPDDELVETHPNYKEQKARHYARRQIIRQVVHATNYYAQPRTLSGNFGISIAEAEKFQNKWFALHPSIKEWHKRTESQLKSTRTVRNRYGYRRIYLDRIEGILPEALAWVPQSTVAITINKIWKGVNDTLSDIQILMQTHDSLNGQFPTYKASWCKEQILAVSRTIVVPYDDPLVIPASIKTSEVSWGECK